MSNQHGSHEVANGLFECCWQVFLWPRHPPRFFNLNFFFIVSPDILDDPTSHDIIVQELENVTLSCTATGSPGLFAGFNESLGNF